MASKAKVKDRPDSENFFCMILTNGRLYQGLALYRSLVQVMGDDFFLFIHCVDDESRRLIKKLGFKNLYVIREKNLDKNIRLLKEQRKIHEYCWTLKPVLCEYVLTSYPNVKRITFLDSDLYFWGDPRSIFKNQSDCSVLLSKEEKYKPNMNQVALKRRITITGIYNSGFISFKQDEIGIQAVKWWKEKCLGNCRISPEESLFGDQKYLDELPKLFPSICSITTPGVNIGPWNELKYQFSNVNKSVFIDDHLLIFYHFSGLRMISEDTIQSVYRENQKNRPFIYQEYQNELSNSVDLIKNVEPSFNGFANEADLQKYWN
ncbi:putative nucleotide-diphospho-sugar transferase [Neobacillus sp. OS1-2]|uniref:putative nucleotide-diphospho-sugar transferase n=1 Tax=Neobacillus sp. OS1-2 TaxID=3070680 RepID=UPI0027DF27B6|nr:putative nucleotide-diphospho-sugar transferase [Neobacillus sp. OS1-2]WML39951.1 putative nucleotide-diphospho-sugar transferase [Neobacillus sp. OS1-2]